MPKPKKVNINKNNVSEKERVLELAKRDIVSFGQLFLPEDFMKSTPAAYHYELNNLSKSSSTLEDFSVVTISGSDSSVEVSAFGFKN